MLGRAGLLHFHRGSALCLAVQLAISNGALWLLAYALHGRLLFAVNCAALPATAAVFLWASGTRMCRVALQAPGIQRPLADLHASLALAQ